MKRALAGPSFTEQLLLDAVVDIQQNPDATEAAFMARQLVQCTLPHSDPGDVPIWTRTNGNLTLTVRPDFDRKTHKALYLMAQFPGCCCFGLSRKLNGRRADIYAWVIAWTRS